VRLDGKAPSSRAKRRDPGERRTPLRLLDRHVASLLAMTIPPERDVL
jgi:hypothetical protein